MAFIYKITNIHTGMCYIGMTIYEVEKRYKRHIENGKKIRGSLKLAKSLQEYGTINHNIITLEECDDEIARERETYWIKKLNTIEKGYNMVYSKADEYVKEYWLDKEKATENIKNGKTWNTGISPPDIVRQKIIDTRHERKLLGLYDNSYGHPHSEETKKNISKMRKEFHKNGGINSQSIIYQVVDEEGNIDKITKEVIVKKYKLTEREWKTLYIWCKRYRHTGKLHPKMKISLDWQEGASRYYAR